MHEPPIAKDFKRHAVPSVKSRLNYTACRNRGLIKGFLFLSGSGKVAIGS
jgi:hypothetical protein